MSTHFTPAAQYLRMSTEMQRYSIENQAFVIAQYAAANGFSVAQTYEDPGRSGVILKNRPGLTALLRDVVSGPAYKAILVYDVSRWGRFQDVDESAHYEFLCRSAGIPIHYCAEQFANDGSLPSLIIKSVKRAMAAEFSRELGDKVLRGKQRLTEMGFSVGARAPYGFRRMLVAPDGSHKQILNFGESKNLTTDRVVLVHGPSDELETVRQIFRYVLEDGLRAEGIARRLNESGIPFSDGGRWSRENVDRLLRNPKYTGTNVWGRSTSRLHTRTRDIPKDQWSTRDSCFPAIIDAASFERVQKYLGDWRWTNEELLEGLREVWRREGEVTGEVLCRTGYGPCSSTVLARFGSMKKALDLIGYVPPPHKIAFNIEHRQASIRLQKRVLKQIARIFRGRVKVVPKPAGAKREILLDGRTKVAVLMANPQVTSFGKTSWGVFPRADEHGRAALCCFASHDYKEVIAFYATASMPEGSKVTIKASDSRFVKLTTLSSFCEIFSRWSDQCDAGS